ncbi:hypothetical protein [Acidianus infernus]|uniref:hypothetical protein n=1 Tax=Acidianus infernus TaxID=12915 RepID=UPI00197ABC02|nr:hypothetical protein [Acidianus infernus]
MDKLRLEIILSALLFISSFFPHYCLYLLTIISFGILLRLKYFPPFVSSVLLLFSPFHALITLLAFPLLYIDRKFSISFSLATLFSLLTQNYLILFLAGALEKRGLIISGIMFLILGALTMNEGYSNIAYFLLIAGVISAIIEGKISLRTSAVIYLSALAFYFKLSFFIPAIVSFSPLVSLLFSPFYPYFAIISIKYVSKFRRLKFLNYVPSALSFINPFLSFSSLYDAIMKREIFLYILLPLFSSIYFIMKGEYIQEEIISISIIFLFILNILRGYYKLIISFIDKYSQFIISLALDFIAYKFFLFNLEIFLIIVLSSIIISLPKLKTSIYPFFASIMSLVNPFVGLSAVQKLSSLFVFIPLFFYIEMHYSVYSVIFYIIGAFLGMVFSVRDFNIGRNIVFVIFALLLTLDDVLLRNYIYIAFSLVSAVLILLFRRNLNISEILALYFASFPLSFISGFFILLKGKLNLCIILVTEAVISVLVLKIVSITSPILSQIL